VVANNHLFFQADNGSHSDKVFVTDGVTATQLLEPPYRVEPFQPLDGQGSAWTAARCPVSLQQQLYLEIAPMTDVEAAVGALQNIDEE
jgi:hypothetical protein